MLKHPCIFRNKRLSTMNSESFVNYILAKEKTPSPGTRLLKEVKILSEVFHEGVGG